MYDVTLPFGASGLFNVEGEELNTTIPLCWFGFANSRGGLENLSIPLFERMKK